MKTTHTEPQDSAPKPRFAVSSHLPRIVSVFALLVLSSHAVFAQSGSTQWTGSTSTDFYDGTNWANGQYPNGNTTFVDSSLTGAANTTVDRASGTARYIYGLYFSNTLGTQNSYTINGPTRFDIGGSVIRTAEVTSGSLTDVINADIADTGQADVWDIRANHHLDMNGVYSGGNTTTKIGDGILTFNGANTYTGATFVNAGTLKLGNNSALGTTAGATTVASGAALDTAGFNPNDGENFTISGTGTDGAGGTGALYSSANSTSFGGNTTITLAGDTEIGGGGGRIDNFATIDGGGFNLTKVGTENWYNWSGNASNIGTLIVDTGAFMGLPNAALANAASNGVQVKENAHVQTWGTGQNFTTNWTFENGSKFTNDWNANNTSTHEISGNITLNGTVEFGANSNAGVSRVTTLSGAISGAGALVKTGLHELVLTGDNSFTGDTSINAGTLKISGSGQLGSGSYAGAITNSGIFEYNSSATQTLSGVISGGGELVVSAGTLILSNDTTAVTHDIGSGATLELASGYTIAGGTNGATTFTGGGTLLVSGNISGQGDQLKMSMDSGATINIQAGGSLTYGSGGDEWTGNLADVINNGNMYGAANSFSIDKLDGSGSITMGSGTINLGVDNGDGGVFNGSIGRNYADAHINKQGTGTQTLNGSVNMGSSGTVTVSGGTLVFNGTSSGSNATGSWIVQNGATLSGSGTLSGTATIGDGATLSPGNSPGTQTFNNLTWVNGGTYLWEINADTPSGGTQGADPGWDWISVTNTFDLSGITNPDGFTIDITSLTSGNTPGLASGFDITGKTYGDAFESFTILSFGSLTGDFDANEFKLETGNFENKVGWSLELVGTDLVLNAVFVPEPSSTALLGLGLSSLLLRRKRS